MVCFECRKMFRRRLLSDISHGQKESVEPKCPQCGGLMANMGLDFKSPKKDDIKAWKHMQNLFSVGITFHSCGCSGPGYIPTDKEKIIERLQQTKARYVENLRLWSTIELPKNKAEFDVFYQKNFYRTGGSLPLKLNKEYIERKLDKQDAVNYWNDRLREIDEHIESLK